MSEEESANKSALPDCHTTPGTMDNTRHESRKLALALALALAFAFALKRKDRSGSATFLCTYSSTRVRARTRVLQVVHCVLENTLFGFDNSNSGRRPGPVSKRLPIHCRNSIRIFKFVTWQKKSFFFFHLHTLVRVCVCVFCRGLRAVHPSLALAR